MVATGRGRRVGAHPPSRIHVEARIPQGSGPFCFSHASRGLHNRWPVGRPGTQRHAGLLFNKLPRGLLLTESGASLHSSGCSSVEERDHATVEAPGSIPGIRSTRHLMAGVLRHHGHAAPHEVQGRPECAPRGRPRRAASQRFGGDPPSRWSTTAMRFQWTYRSASPRRAHASRVEIGRNDWAAPEPVTGTFMPR